MCDLEVLLQSLWRKTSYTHSYDEIVILVMKIRVNYVFNYSYTLEFQVEYVMILLIRIIYVSEGVTSNENCKTKFSNTLMRSDGVQGQNEQIMIIKLCLQRNYVNYIVLVYINE